MRYVFLDSGQGGLSYCLYLRQRHPSDSFLYLADTAFFPYGEKSQKDLSRRLRRLTDLIAEKFRPDILFVVCNTASLNFFTPKECAHWPFPIKTLEPPWERACASSKTKHIAFLGTRSTIDLLESQKRSYLCATELWHSADLVLFAETGELTEDLESFLETKQREIQEKMIDLVVLGCTHFVQLEEYLRHFWPVSFIDSRQEFAECFAHDVHSAQRVLSEPENILYTTSEVLSETYRHLLQEDSWTYGGIFDENFRSLDSRLNKKEGDET